MKQCLILIQVQLSNLFDFNKIFNGKARNSKTKKYAFYFTTAFTLLSLVAASFFYSYGIGTTLKLIGATELLPEMVMALTCMITMITTIYKVKGILFGFKDYDLVMSLPVRNSTVVISRLALLYILNIVFTLIVIIPASIAYGIIAKPGIPFYILSFLTTFFVPVIPMIAAAIIGTLITALAAKFRHSNVLYLIFTFGVIIGVMAFSFLAGDSEEVLGQISVDLTRQVDRIYPLARMYRLAVCEYDIVSILLFFSISILAAGVFSYIVGLKFKAINTALAGFRTKADYKLVSQAQSGPFMALYKKELGRFLSSGVYIFNTSFGLVMLVIGSVVTLFLSQDELSNILELPQMVGLLSGLAPFFISVCVTMTYITACSISLEGKNLWILKSAPVKIETIFYSKIAVPLTLTLPAILISAITITIGLRLSLAEFIMHLILPALYAILTAVSGLIINLLVPKLDWTSEVTVIKQSTASFIATFYGMIVVIIPAATLFVWPHVNRIYIHGGTAVVILVITLCLFRYLVKTGVERFRLLMQ